MIDQLLRRQWEREPSAGDAVVPVPADNVRSWRALEKAGFAHVADGELDPDNPIDDRRHRIMVRRRPPGALRSAVPLPLRLGQAGRRRPGR